jgi:hypothetical protein
MFNHEEQAGLTKSKMERTCEACTKLTAQCNKDFVTAMESFHQAIGEFNTFERYLNDAVLMEQRKIIEDDNYAISDRQADHRHERVFLALTSQAAQEARIKFSKAYQAQLRCEKGLTPCPNFETATVNRVLLEGNKLTEGR